MESYLRYRTRTIRSYKPFQNLPDICWHWHFRLLPCLYGVAHSHILATDERTDSNFDSFSCIRQPIDDGLIDVYPINEGTTIRPLPELAIYDFRPIENEFERVHNATVDRVSNSLMSENFHKISNSYRHVFNYVSLCIPIIQLYRLYGMSFHVMKDLKMRNE